MAINWDTEFANFSRDQKESVTFGFLKKFLEKFAGNVPDRLIVRPGDFDELQKRFLSALKFNDLKIDLGSKELKDSTNKLIMTMNDRIGKAISESKDIDLDKDIVNKKCNEILSSMNFSSTKVNIDSKAISQKFTQSIYDAIAVDPSVFKDSTKKLSESITLVNDKLTVGIDQIAEEMFGNKKNFQTTFKGVQNSIVSKIGKLVDSMPSKVKMTGEVSASDMLKYLNPLADQKTLLSYFKSDPALNAFKTLQVKIVKKIEENMSDAKFKVSGKFNISSLFVPPTATAMEDNMSWTVMRKWNTLQKNILDKLSATIADPGTKFTILKKLSLSSIFMPPSTDDTGVRGLVSDMLRGTVAYKYEKLQKDLLGKVSKAVDATKFKMAQEITVGDILDIHPTDTGVRGLVSDMLRGTVAYKYEKLQKDLLGKVSKAVDATKFKMAQEITVGDILDIHPTDDTGVRGLVSDMLRGTVAYKYEKLQKDLLGKVSKAVDATKFKMAQEITVGDILDIRPTDEMGKKFADVGIRFLNKIDQIDFGTDTKTDTGKDTGTDTGKDLKKDIRAERENALFKFQEGNYNNISDILKILREKIKVPEIKKEGKEEVITGPGMFDNLINSFLGKAGLSLLPYLAQAALVVGVAYIGYQIGKSIFEYLEKWKGKGGDPNAKTWWERAQAYEVYNPAILIPELYADLEEMITGREKERAFATTESQHQSAERSKQAAIDAKKFEEELKKTGIKDDARVFRIRQSYLQRLGIDRPEELKKFAKYSDEEFLTQVEGLLYTKAKENLDIDAANEVLTIRENYYKKLERMRHNVQKEELKLKDQEFIKNKPKEDDTKPADQEKTDQLMDANMKNNEQLLQVLNIISEGNGEIVEQLKVANKKQPTTIIQQAAGFNTPDMNQSMVYMGSAH